MSVPDVTKWMWMSLNKDSHDVILARLRSGCTSLNNHLYNLNMRDSQFCNFCINKRETVEHFTLECQEYNNFRRTLFNDLAKLNIDQDKVNLQLLLTSDWKNKYRKQILSKFINYVKLTKKS